MGEFVVENPQEQKRTGLLHFKFVGIQILMAAGMNISIKFSISYKHNQKFIEKYQHLSK